MNRVIDADELMGTVMAYASDLAANVSPASMATIKHQLNTEVDLSADDALEHAEGLMVESLRGADVGEGIASFLSRFDLAAAQTARAARTAIANSDGQSSATPRADRHMRSVCCRSSGSVHIAQLRSHYRSCTIITFVR